MVHDYIFVDRNALDILHHEVWEALFRQARIEQTRNVWMNQIGENLTLCGKSDEKTVCASGAALHHLDGNLLLVKFVGTAREIHLAHAALADQIHHLVVPDALPAPVSTRRDALGSRLPWFLKESPCLVGGLHQKFNLRPQRRIVRAGPVEEALTLGGIEVQRRMEKLFERLPVLLACAGLHGSGICCDGAGQLSVKKRLGHFQLPMHRYIGDPERSRGFLVGETAEED